MNRLAYIFALAAALYATSPVAQALATSHVRPPGVTLKHPMPADPECSWGEIPAWIQAVGTILAFAAAFYFSSRDHRRSIKLFQEERDREEGIRHLRAHSLAHALYPDLLEIKAKIPVSEAAIAKQRSKSELLKLVPGITQNWIVDVPKGFGSAGETFYLFGTDAAPVVSQLLSLLNQHNRAAGTLINELNRDTTRDRAWDVFQNRELFANRFELMKKDAELALDLIGKIRDRELLPEYTLKDRNARQRTVAPTDATTHSDDTAPS